MHQILPHLSLLSNNEYSRKFHQIVLIDIISIIYEQATTKILTQLQCNRKMPYVCKEMKLKKLTELAENSTYTINLLPSVIKDTASEQGKFNHPTTTTHVHIIDYNTLIEPMSPCRKNGA